MRFLASEYATGKTHQGRIDSLGLDENVINQGLFHLDWLLDHEAEFRWLVMEKLGREVADGVEWSGTRLPCIRDRGAGRRLQPRRQPDRALGHR